jgi:hypothetical protein
MKKGDKGVLILLLMAAGIFSLFALIFHGLDEAGSPRVCNVG